MGRVLWVSVVALTGFIVALTVVARGPAQASDRELADLLSGVVGVRAVIPTSARTAELLGTDRHGSGVVIDTNGLVVTIGYLILEASAAEIIDANRQIVPAEVVGYDHETGFGLVRALAPLKLPPVPFGSAAALKPGDPVVVASRGGETPAAPAVVVSRRPFAGYWEYLVEEAVFTRPPVAGYGGAALFSADGRLAGIGSLFVGDAQPGMQPSPGNMFVPIDELKPILADLVATGRRAGPAEPWLGIYAREAEGRVFVTRLADGGPADEAGLGAGDRIIGVDGKRIAGLADFWRRVRELGDAGVEVALDVVRYGDVELAIERVTIPSADRHDWLRLARSPAK